MHCMDDIGSGTFNIEANLKTQMLPDVLAGNITLEIQDSRHSALLESNAIKAIEENHGGADDCSGREMIYAIQSTKNQLADQGSIILQPSTRQRSVLASTTAAPQSPVRAKKKGVKVEPKEENTGVLNYLPSPSTLQVIPQDSIYIMEGMHDTMALSTSEPHISSTIAECQALGPVANLRRSERKRKGPVKFGDDKRRKVKREIRKESNNLLSIAQFDSMETIALVHPAAVAVSETPISDSTPVADSPGGPNNLETAMRRIATQQQGHSAKQSNAGMRGDNIGTATSHSLSKAKLKSAMKRADDRKHTAALGNRPETMLRPIAEEQCLLLDIARPLKQPVENIKHDGKSGPGRRSSSAPAGRRAPRILHSIREQDESASLARNTRASSEVPRYVKLEVKKPTTRGSSAPPLRSFSKNRQNTNLKEIMTEAWDFVHQQLNPRGRRVCTEGAMPEITLPTVAQLPYSASTSSARKYKNYVGLRVPRETKLKRKRAAAISVQKKGYAECDSSDESSSDVDMDISDALDISDSNTSIDKGGFPSDLSEKLERAEKRPRLELIQLKGCPTVTRKGKKRTIVKNEKGDGEGGTEDLPYDSRYHPSAVSYDTKAKKWVIPFSCKRYVIILPYIYFTGTSKLTDWK